MKIDKREVQRYMGFRNGTSALSAEALEELDTRTEDAIRRVLEAASPKNTWAAYPLSFLEDAPDAAGKTGIRIGPVRVYSRDLAKNLEGCTEAVLLACTLGLGPDRLVRMCGTRSLFRAALYQAAGAAAIEAYTDDVNEEIRASAASRRMAAKPRYSPGYGDLSLEMQKDIFELLKLPKTIGLTLTDSLLMVPTKSVTAVIGLMPEEGVPG
ncbi:MAG: Vitamin B12 dependent methionine synthase activation subunit [Lachnospiraceae bacterium]|nr:Vitamin B12 dependent methionine synthase activation subunit [Lachnospiraceae bacterium]